MSEPSAFRKWEDGYPHDYHTLHGDEIPGWHLGDSKRQAWNACAREAAKRINADMQRFTTLRDASRAARIVESLLEEGDV